MCMMVDIFVEVNLVQWIILIEQHCLSDRILNLPLKQLN